MESVNRFVLEKIREFLIEKLDSHSRIYAENTKLISIIDQKGSSRTDTFSYLTNLSNRLCF